MASEFKVGTISKLLANGSGVKTDPKIAALFGGGSSTKVFKTVKVTENQIFSNQLPTISSVGQSSGGSGNEGEKKKKKKQKPKKAKVNADAVMTVPEAVVPGTKIGKKKLKQKKATVDADAGRITAPEAVVPKIGKKEKRKLKKEKRKLKREQEKSNDAEEKVQNPKLSDSTVKLGKKKGPKAPVTDTSGTGKASKKNKKNKKTKPMEVEQVEIKEEVEIKEKYDSDEMIENEDIKIKQEVKEEVPQTGNDTKTLAERNAPKPKNEEQDSRTIFVGNLPKDVEKKQLKKNFKKFGTIQAIRFRCGAPSKPTVLKKVAVNKKELHPDNNTLVAYIRFSTLEEAEKASMDARGMVLQDHHLTIDLASSKGKVRDNKRAIFVGNLNFKVTDEELWRFFEDCGKIVSVRIVRDNATGLGKGFGYVNFEEREAVDNAIANKNQQELKSRSVRIKRCVKKLKVKKEKPSKVPRGQEKFKRSFDRKEMKQNAKNSRMQRPQTNRPKEYGGDRLAEIGKLKRKSHKPNRAEVKKAKIAKLLTKPGGSNKRKVFKK